ncbi:hypothetical protein FF36_05440 [Frankia torreyi]|uniref:Uncharacterized protein n=1 Tax=Frankia torreyi TaxID=1856 RepID=A0A0D8B7N0_9ACTN|nr:hypothetical protein FF36_05440 [Frankia torreyi]KQM02600.1 hypothetical protein FF86_106115 [Frankia sp. CpI1-P]
MRHQGTKHRGTAAPRHRGTGTAPPIVDGLVCLVRLVCGGEADGRHQDATRGGGRGGPPLGAGAVARRRGRAVLRRGRPDGRHRPDHRAGRGREGVAVQHLRQQGGAGPRLPGRPARRHDRATPAGGGPRAGRPVPPAGDLRGAGGAVRPTRFPWLCVRLRQRRDVPRQLRGACRRRLPGLDPRPVHRARPAGRRRRPGRAGPPAPARLRRCRPDSPDGPHPAGRPDCPRDGRDPARRGDPGSLAGVGLSRAGRSWCA